MRRKQVRSRGNEVLSEATTADPKALGCLGVGEGQ